MKHRAGWVLGLAAIAASACLVKGQRATPSEEAYRRNNLGVAHLEQYDHAAAAAAFRHALELSPSLTIARLNLSIALLYLGDLSNAAREALLAAAQMPSAPPPFYVLGLVARADNRPADAATSFEKVLQLDPEDVGARIQLAQVHLADQRYTQAADLFEAALAREPFNATAAYGRAMALTRGGQRVAGAAAMTRFQALRQNPAAITYSSTYLEQGRYAEAVVSTGLEPELVETVIPAVTFTNATAAMFGGQSPAGSPTLFDRDGDGDLDLLVVAPGGLQLLDNEGGRFTPRRAFPADAPGGTGAVAGDVDNDGRIDLLIIGDTDRLYLQASDGTFSNVGWRGGDGKTATRTAALVDIDHDGDLDIFLAPPTLLMRNNGNGTFVDITTKAKLTDTSATVAVVPTDYDNRRDIDLLLLSQKRVALLANLRDGTFRDVAADVRLPGALPYTAVATGDINKDNVPDFAFARAGGPALLATSDRAGRFAVAELPPPTAGATAIQLVDYDNDGLLDLLALTAAGPKLWRFAGRSWTDASARAFDGLGPAKEAAVALSTGDGDGDGDTDVVVRLSSGRLALWRNDGGTRHSSLRVRLAARVSNRSAVGAKVEVRAGSLRHRLEVSAATPPAGPVGLLFGLGPRARADAVRVLWPAGILQSETDVAGSVSTATLTRGASHATATIQELDRKPSSCPFLFTWNGSRFEFVTDFLGGGELGYWVAPGVRNTPDPDEYVRIRSDQLRQRDGRYELRVTNELEEAVFIDRLQLLAITHRIDSDVYPNEGLRSAGQRHPLTIHTTGRARPPHRALDHHGHDVLGRIAALDRVYADDFRLEPIQGYAEDHALHLDLGVPAPGAPVRLLLTGWTDYAFSSDNVAAHQAGLEFSPPSLQIRNRDGTWRTALPEIGLPVGRPQTVVVDLTPHLSNDKGRVEVRIPTTLRVYWDQVLVDTSRATPYGVARLDPIQAQLRRRGFSAETSPDGRAPFTYRYDDVSLGAPWKSLPGRYTREGDVAPLLVSTDDRFVVMASGDEIALAFDAAELSPLEPGLTRTFLLHADGFSKEMNLHSSSPDRLGPLPFHGMSVYPYPPSEQYPTTSAHESYRTQYNTRVVGGPVPALETTVEHIGCHPAARCPEP
jgi:Tfp pilus assembly protein PilF